MCARRRSNFLLSRQEKVTKEKATLLCVSLRCATGNLRCSGRGCAAELTARLQRSVQTTAASQCTKCVCPTAHARTPCPALLGTHRREPATGHPHGPSLRSAPSARAQAPRAAQTGPSAAMARMDVRLRVPFRMRRGAQRPADQGSRLFERSEFERDPAGREHRRLPAAKRRDAACRVAFSLVTFSWRGKRKLLRRRAHTPAPALSKGILKAIKTIANSACCISAKGQNHSEIRSSNIASP